MKYFEHDDCIECQECGCISTNEQVNNSDIQHWKECSALSSDEDFTGASDEQGYANDR